MKSNFKRNLIISSGLSMLILAISSIASYLSIDSLIKSNRIVNHTQEVIYNLNQGSYLMIDAQTSMRGYIITGKKDFLNRYDAAEDNVNIYFEKVGFLTQDNPLQQKEMKELFKLNSLFFQYLDQMILDKTNGKVFQANDLEAGRKAMANIKQVLRRIENQEKSLLTQRISASERMGVYSSIIIIIAAIIAMTISSLFFIRILRDFTERLKLQKDLEKSEEETAERIQVISSIAGQISQGNYNIRVNESASDALGSVGTSLNNMAASLETSFNTLSEKEWLQTGIAELNKVMIGEKRLDLLTHDVIEYVSIYTQSMAGVLYLLEDKYLDFSAGYSYLPTKERQKINLGDGITGQCAISKEIIFLDLKDQNVTISYALGAVNPTAVIAIPLINENVVGVLELASTKPFSAKNIDFLKNVSNYISIAIKAAQNRKRVQELLEETQVQSEELKSQHTELEGINAELETQTEKLQASEEELRVQQEELQQTNEELAQRSILLEEKNTEIQKKSEDLEMTTRYKSEFLANMSHELRTPLNSILLLSRLLSENNDENMSSEQIEFAKVIQSSGTGLLGLIDEILDLSKIEAGKMELEFLDISIAEISENMHDLFSEIAKQKNIKFNINTQEAPLFLKSDKMRLEQILKNLISNALKFTNQGSVELKIYKDPENDKQICFAVKDTGIGIPREKQFNIFEAFQQADGSTKRKYGGTGLGLSISRELAKLLNGEINLQSVVNQGSVFTLKVPVIGFPVIAATTTNDENSENFTTDNASDENQNHLENKYLSLKIPEDVADDREQIFEFDKTILIVEDDVNFAKSLLEFTRKRGYKGIVSVRGDYALNLALVYKPVGVLLDLQLPMMNGWQVMEELKSNLQTRHIPVHMMSSHKLKQESLLKGAINFLDKPVAFEQMPEIFKRIEHIINRESQKVLIVEDNPQHAKALSYFLESNNINSEIRSEVSAGVDALQSKNVDCVILDMGIPAKQAYEILENIKKNPGLENLPIIVFTGKSLSMQEELKIKKYADSIVIKTAHSYQRMLDEVSLFLHLVEENKNKIGAKQNFKKQSLMNNVLSDKTVLIVDDDVRNIFSLTKALEVLKMNVLTAIDGEEALKVLEQNPEIDVVLLDMMMPNMDGYETATRIRNNKGWKNLPVIAVTAKAMTGDREKCINAGASDYITKPVDIDQLLSLLRVWLYNQA